MKIKWAALGWMLVGAVIASGAVYGYAVITAHVPGKVICAANPCKIEMTRNGSAGLVIQDVHGPRNENPLLIVDPHGLAEFWQNTAGAYEGPKGEICTTNQNLGPIACLGSNGTTGWVSIGGQVLDSADIAWLHNAEAAGRPKRTPAPRLPTLRLTESPSPGRPATGPITHVGANNTNNPLTTTSHRPKPTPRPGHGRELC